LSKKNLIPDLIMGERASVHSTDPSVTADKIAEAIKNLEYWEPQKQAGRFHSKATSYTINDVHLVAQASTPMRAAGPQSAGGIFSGNYRTWRPQRHALHRHGAIR
jgi:hypothetical protein